MAKVLLSLPDSMLSRLDEYCKVNHYERSELVRHLIRLKLDFVYPEENVGVTTPMIHSKGGGVSDSTDKSPKNIKKIEKDPLMKRKYSFQLGTAKPTPENTSLDVSKIDSTIAEITAAKGFWVCEHGMRGRTCKHEKCRQMAVKKGDA